MYRIFSAEKSDVATNSFLDERKDSEASRDPLWQIAFTTSWKCWNTIRPSGQFSWISLLRIPLRWCTYSLRFKSFVYSVNVRFGWNLVTFLLCECKRKLVLFEWSMERIVFIWNDILMFRLARCYLRPRFDISDMFEINRVTCVNFVCFNWKYYLCV